MQILRTPAERFADIPDYPFAENWFETDLGDGLSARMHYIDEGPRDAPPVLLFHGEPSWSFLYRKMIPTLVQAGYRVVAPDFVGFGRSDKLAHMRDYSHGLHTRTLTTLVNALDLESMTMVVQDWGGTTGLSVAEELEKRISRLVIMNAGLPPHGELRDLKVINKVKFARNVMGLLGWKVVNRALGQFLPVGKVFLASCPGISKEAVAGYDAPFPDHRYKAGVAWWPKMVPLTQAGEVAAATRRAKVFLSGWTRPTFVLFSTECPVSGSLYDYFQALIPGVSHYPPELILGAGHFLQEDAGHEISEKIVGFVQSTQLGLSTLGSSNEKVEPCPSRVESSSVES